MMTTTLKTLLAEARQHTTQLSAQDARKVMESGGIGLVVDVREPEEWARGHLPDSANIPRGWLELRADPSSPAADPALTAAKNDVVLLYCLHSPSARSLLAAHTLRQLGYSHATVLDGGLEGWIAAGFDTEDGLGTGTSIHPAQKGT